MRPWAETALIVVSAVLFLGYLFGRRADGERFQDPCALFLGTGILLVVVEGHVNLALQGLMRATTVLCAGLGIAMMLGAWGGGPRPRRRAHPPQSGTDAGRG